VGGPSRIRATGAKGRAWRPRRAHLSAEWRCSCDAKEKRKNSLRRKKVKWADRAGSALPGMSG
jgi:hypothetical protein